MQRQVPFMLETFTPNNLTFVYKVDTEGPQGKTDPKEVLSIESPKLNITELTPGELYNVTIVEGDDPKHVASGQLIAYEPLPGGVRLSFDHDSLNKEGGGGSKFTWALSVQKLGACFTGRLVSGKTYGLVIRPFES
jgi:hypothetical protein